MSLYWSTFVQDSEELYWSRSLRFHDENKDSWLKVLQIKNGMNVLEVGSGSGIFCHRIKQYLPDTKITGIDFDAGHIEYAKKKTKKLNLDCDFIVSSATNLPFADNNFDICFSHTVMSFCEPNLFVKEQYRVLKPNGKMIILSGINGGNKSELWLPTEGCEEKELFYRLWNEANKNELSKIKRFDDNESHYFNYLSQQGFKDISIDTLSVVTYAPDCANISRQMAMDQINGERLSELGSVEKAYRLAPHALTSDEFKTLIGMVNRRYDNRIKQYQNSETIWDYNINTVLAISGTK